LAVWDLFLVKGCCVLFSVAFTLFKMMMQELMQKSDYCEIYAFVQNYGSTVTKQSLLQNLVICISNEEVNEARL